MSGKNRAGGVRMRPTRLALGLSAVVVAATVLTSCSPSASSPSPKSTTNIDLPQQNVSQWLMPLDQYIQSRDDVHRIDYAENLLQEPCMEQAGYQWPVPWQDVQTITQSPTQNAVGRSLFSVAIASQWGYHSATVAATSSDLAWQKFVSMDPKTITEAEDKVWEKCLADARKILPILPGSAQTASGLSAQAYTAAAKDPKVLAAAAKWKTCMAPAGISDLPDSPRDMPSPTIQTESDTGGSGEASPTEIQLAVQDAKCRDSSGWTTAAYNAEWFRNAALLEQNADTLERVKKDIADNKAAVMKVITEHAPKEPAGE